MHSSSALLWQGILLEKHISSPGERTPASIGHDVIILLCSNSVRGELLSPPPSRGGHPPGRGYVPYVLSRSALSIYPAGPLPGARLHTSCERLICALDKEFIRGVREEMALPQSDAPGMRLGIYDDPLARLLMLLTQELEAGAPSGILYADVLIQALAVRVVLLGCKASSESRSQASPLSQRVLRRVKDRIDAELSIDLTLPILAEESGYSRTHFQRMFRAATGLTPHQYLLKRRIKRAQELLERRDLGLLDVAASCGFSSQSHMTTVFRKLLGMTPGEYRRHRRL
jgi:AraC family transcriptional regulator